MKVIWKRSLALMVAFVVLMGLIAVFPFGRGVVAEARFCGYGEQAIFTAAGNEVINYTRKEEKYTETSAGAPLYYQLTDYPNSCGAVGGAIIVGFYDRYYTDLIPNFDPMTPKGTYKRNDRVYVPQLMGELYALMRTNVDDVGVSQTDCLNGLKTYMQNHGRSISYSNVLTSNRIDELAYTNALNSNKLSLLFCKKLDINYINDSVSNVDEIGVWTLNGAHVAVAYGLLEIKYFYQNGLFRTDKYLNVAIGLSEEISGYIKLNANDWLNAAYIVTVT